MKNIKILKDAMDGSKWIEIFKDEYDFNYTDKINFMYCFDHDTGKIGYYRKEIMEPLRKEWFRKEVERMG